MPPKLRGRHLKRYAMLRVFELSQTQVFGIKAKFPLPTLCGRQFFFCAAKEKPEISFPQIIKVYCRQKVTMTNSYFLPLISKYTK